MHILYYRENHKENRKPNKQIKVEVTDLEAGFAYVTNLNKIAELLDPERNTKMYTMDHCVESLFK